MLIIESGQRTRFSADTQDRFRWAVCQLDALQWLRCERDIVQNALAHLPKTLFETYDRIFLSIPEDERLFVHHALRWICFNDEVYNNTGIPCAVLLQAVERSIACITSSQRDRFVDEETLQQLCGCLIRIEPRRHHDKDHLEYTIPTVSFAHYTVREYVDSARFSGISRAYFDACIEIFLDLTFLQTQHVESTQQQVIEVLEAGKTAFQVLATDFTVYCVVSAISLLHRWSLDIPRPHTLNNLAFVLLNPSTPHFKILATLAPHIEASIGDFISMPFNNMASAFRIRWILDVTDTNAAVFFYLLLFNLSNSDGFALAHAFLQERESTRLLRSRLTFSDWLSGRVLDGSVIEVLVEYGAKRDEVELILHYGAGLFDPSKILILGVGNLWSASCIAVIEPFLKLGADPCGAEFYITPLQIVVYNCYIEGVQKLLEAGADPNGTGNKDGITFKENSFVGRFLHLHQVRPLNICRQRFWGSSQGLSRNIEDLLLQFGAEADPNGDTIVCHYSRPS